MDYFNDVLMTFLGLEHGSCIAVYGGFHQKYLFSKMNKGLAGLEQHEGE